MLVSGDINPNDIPSCSSMNCSTLSEKTVHINIFAIEVTHIY